MTTNVKPFPLPVDQPLPGAPEAERALLGGMLIGPELAPEVLATCRAEWFQHDRHRYIYESIERIVKAGHLVDFASISDDLRSNDRFDDVGGGAAITELYDSMQRLDNLDGYIRIIREKAKLRAMAKAGNLQMAESLSGDYAPDEIAKRAADRIERISAGGLDESGDEIASVLERLHERVTDPSKAVGIPTGLPWLDRMTNGIGRQALWLLAAYTSVGKSALAASIALEAAAAGYWVDVLTYEMTREEYAGRLLSVGWGIDLVRLDTGMLSPEEFDRYRLARTQLCSSRLRICEASGMSARDIRGRAHRFARRKELDLLIVDYLGLISASDARKSETEIMNQVARDLKIIAGESNCGLLALHQINREGAKTGHQGAEPQLWWLRYAGEAHANAVMFLTREEGETQGNLYLKKQRNGPTGKCALHFEPRFARFLEAQ